MKTRSGAKRKGSNLSPPTPKASRPDQTTSRSVIKARKSLANQSQTSFAPSAMEGKIDTILLGLEAINTRIDNNAAQIQSFSGLRPAMSNPYIDVDDSESEDSDGDDDVFETHQPKSKRGKNHRGHPNGGRGSRGGRGGRGGHHNDRGRSNSSNGRHQSFKDQRRHSEGSRPRSQNGGHSQRGGGLTKAMTKEIRSLVRREISEENFQSAKSDRQVIIEGIPSKKDDSKATEYERVMEKLKSIMNDFKITYIKSIQRFQNPSPDGTFPIIVTMRTRKLVQSIFDFIEEQPENLWPWLQPGRTRETRRRNAEIKQRMQALNEKLLKSNSPTLWEEFQVGTFISHKKIPNVHYVPQAGASNQPQGGQITEPQQMNERPIATSSQSVH